MGTAGTRGHHGDYGDRRGRRALNTGRGVDLGGVLYRFFVVVVVQTQISPGNKEGKDGFWQDAPRTLSKFSLSPLPAQSLMFRSCSKSIPNQMELWSWGLPCLNCSKTRCHCHPGQNPHRKVWIPMARDHPAIPAQQDFSSCLSCFSSSFTFPWHSQPCPSAAPWSPALHPHLTGLSCPCVSLLLGWDFDFPLLPFALAEPWPISPQVNQWINCSSPSLSPKSLSFITYLGNKTDQVFFHGGSQTLLSSQPGSPTPSSGPF